MIFCMSGGGSGSTHIIRTMRKKQKVIARPDRCLEINGIGGVPHTYNWYTKVTNEIAVLFNERADIKVKPGCTVKDMFKKFLKKTKRTVVLSGNICQLGIKTNWTLWCNPVFIIRHPLHNFVSWYKHQHKEMQIDGKLDSDATIQRFAEYWNNVAWYALQCKIIRYEFAKQDAKKINMPSWMFKDLKCGKRNNGVLSKRAEQYLESICQYKFIYDEWKI